MIIAWTLLVIIMLMIAGNGSRIAKLQKSMTALQADVDRLSERRRIDDILDQ